ncbi:hypothetical protein ACYZTX_16040 [Pseudomonas sp. MDT1-17]
MTVAADKGWFFGWSTSLEDLIPLIERIASLPDDGIDQCMVDCSGLLSEILSVESPLGMMRDIKGQSKVRSTTAGHLLKQRFEFDQESLDLLHPFFTLHESDFLKSSAARSQSSRSNVAAFTAQNRHQVMHGEGTEVNSLKALSLLVFVGLHLQSICSDQDILR